MVDLRNSRGVAVIECTGHGDKANQRRRRRLRRRRTRSGIVPDLCVDSRDLLAHTVCGETRNRPIRCTHTAPPGINLRWNVRLRFYRYATFDRANGNYLPYRFVTHALTFPIYPYLPVSCPALRLSLTLSSPRGRERRPAISFPRILHCEHAVPRRVFYRVRTGLLQPASDRPRV